MRVFVDLDCLRRFVACIVGGKDRNVALCIRDRFGGVKRHRVSVCTGRLFRIDYGAVQRKNRYIGEVLVIACNNRNRIAVFLCGCNLRRGIVDRKVEAHKCAFAELAA